MEVSLNLYDSRGILVKTLVKDNQVAGEYSIDVDLSTMTSGVYTYTLVADRFTASKKLIKQ